jgi:hypothetical protein
MMRLPVPVTNKLYRPLRSLPNRALPISYPHPPPLWSLVGASSESSAVLTAENMEAYRAGPSDGGHAVVVTCASGPLKLMNSWGALWGDQGFFWVRDGASLGCDDCSKMQFFDVFFLETDLSDGERLAYQVADREHKALEAELKRAALECRGDCCRSAGVTPTEMDTQRMQLTGYLKRTMGYQMAGETHPPVGVKLPAVFHDRDDDPEP